MERANHPPDASAPYYVFILLLCLQGSLSFGQNVVRIKGQVIVPVHVRTPVDLTMDVGDTACVLVELKGRGRFTIETPYAEKYELRFEQEGSITKTVVVDTQYARKRLGDGKRDVKFDVVLAPVDTIVPLRYAGPVGRVNFHHSNGRMVVQKDQHLVNTEVIHWPK